MKKHLFILLTIIFPLVCVAQKRIVIKNVTIIDVKTGKVDKDKTVIIYGNRIESVISKGSSPTNAITIDGKGKYLIPGLWDMHAHAISENRYEYTFPLLVANGVTGIREMGTFLPIEKVTQLRNDVLNGTLPGPRLGSLTYKIIDGAGTEASVKVQVTTPDQAREIVRTYKQQGADFIKPYNQLSRELYLAIIDEAKKQHIPVEGHVPFSMTIDEISDLGQKSIEHNFGVLIYCAENAAELRKQLLAGKIPWGQLDATAAKWYDKKKSDSLYRKFVNNGTWLCPTTVNLWPLSFQSDSVFMMDSLMKYIPKKIRQQWHETFLFRTRNVPDPADRAIRQKMIMVTTADMYHAGVRLLAGTDFPEPYMYPGFSLHQELEFLVKAGLSPLDALRTATWNPAIFLGKEKDFGTVEKGKMADLVLLDANPLENISNTKKIFAVVTNGKLLQRNELDAMLNEVKELADK